MTYADIDTNLNAAVDAKLAAGTLKANSVTLITALELIMKNASKRSMLLSMIADKMNSRIPYSKSVGHWANMIRTSLLIVVRMGYEEAAVNAYTAAFGS